MLKRADAPYVPNGRGDWLKLKTQARPAARPPGRPSPARPPPASRVASPRPNRPRTAPPDVHPISHAQVIPGLGDTITVGLIGARFGTGLEGGSLAEFCFGALVNPCAVAAGAPPAWAWLFNSAVGLPRESARRLSDDCLGLAIEVARMCKLERGAPPPKWLQFAPTAGATRPHYVLRRPEWALPTDVWGQRFLPAGADDSAASPFFLRFPSVFFGLVGDDSH